LPRTRCSTLYSPRPKPWSGHELRSPFPLLGKHRLALFLSHSIVDASGFFSMPFFFLQSLSFFRRGLGDALATALKPQLRNAAFCPPPPPPRSEISRPCTFFLFPCIFSPSMQGIFLLDGPRGLSIRVSKLRIPLTSQDNCSDFCPYVAWCQLDGRRPPRIRVPWSSPLPRWFPFLGGVRRSFNRLYLGEMRYSVPSLA